MAAKGKVTIKDNDKRYKKFVTSVKALDKVFIQIGLQAGDKADKRVKKKGQADTIIKTDTDIAQIAAMNEFGTDHVPSRPFMRQTWERWLEEMNKHIKAEYEAVIAGRKSAVTSLQALGLWYETKMKMQIVEGDFAPNSPVTENRKGSTRPLIDTGRMRQSIRYVIKERP